MAKFDGFLMRDNLSDSGAVPSPGYHYMSPDLICHSQVADPQGFFAGNYTSDPNQEFDGHSRFNYIYTRAKNLSEKTLSGYFASAYEAPPSLYLTPSLWKNRPLKTKAGNSYVTLPSTASGKIAVGDEPLFFDATKSGTHTCLVGIASNTKTPTIPNDFTHVDDFILWIRNNQNICARNLNIRPNTQTRSHEEIQGFKNPGVNDIPTLFVVEVSGTPPKGTVFGLTCAPLKINRSWKTDDGTTKGTASGITPPGFNGNVTTFADNPTGKWPDGFKIQTTVYVGVRSDSAAAMFRDPQFPEPGQVASNIKEPHLVLLGSCATIFKDGQPA